MPDTCTNCGYQHFEHTDKNAQQCGADGRAKKGFTMSIHQCIKSKGFQHTPSVRHVSSVMQQGEGRFFMTRKQMG